MKKIKKTFLALKKKITTPKGLIISLILLFFLGGISWLTVISLRTYKTIQRLKTDKKLIREAINSQNLLQLETAFKSTDNDLQQLQTDLTFFQHFEDCPFIGSYLQDSRYLIKGSRKITQSAILLTHTLQPHADLLGLKGGETAGGNSIQERLVLLSETLKEQSPEIKKTVSSFNQGTQLILNINPQHYPQNLFNQPLREKIDHLQTTVKEVNQMLTYLPETIEIIPTLLGSQKPVHYLVLLQNDAELRPTGGFITAYARLEVKRGVVTNSYSEDIYSLDRRFQSHIPAPKPIREYLINIPYWYLRDMNLSPDFKTSMETFYPNYLKVGQPAEAVIAIDTHFLTTLINILGEINLPGYGVFSNKTDPNCHCPQVIYKLEKIVDKPRGTIVKNRKSILSPLMQALINKTLTAPRSSWPQLIKSFYQLGQEKHLLFYSPNPQLEKVAEDWNFAGRVLPTKGDYLLIVDSNMGGAKSNLYITQEVSQKYENDPATNKIKKTVTITYRNPQPWSNCNLESGGLCLNGEYRDWVRLYLPLGSQLVEAKNSLTKVTTYSDLGKTVFDGYIKLRPPGFYRLSFTYLLPFSWAEWQKTNYHLLVQKQGGSKPIKEEIKWQKKKLNFVLNRDTQINNFSLNHD